MSEQPENQEEKLILQAIYKDGHIKLSIQSNHTPSLSYVHKLLGVEIDKLIINEQIRANPASRIITPPKGGIINFIRGKGKTHAG